MGGVNAQSEELKKINKARKIVYVPDKLRSWGNSLDFNFIADSVLSSIEGQDVHVIGNSMGGFLAAIFPNYMSVKTAVVFSSQFSVDPNIVPEERRWMGYRKNIKVYRFSSLEGNIAPNTKYYFFSGAEEAEEIHWRRIPKRDNVLNFVVESSGHDLASDLKRKGILYELIHACQELRLESVQELMEQAALEYRIIS